MLTCCFTGHRPSKLGGYDWNSNKNQKILKILKDKIIKIINDSNENDFTFICGGALGIDQMAFSICYELKAIYNINLILAMPYEEQTNKWFNQEDINRFNKQKSQADKVIIVDTLENYFFNKVSIGEYHPYKLQLRNQYMVDHSDIIIGIWNGSNGGTKNCLDYAKKNNKIIYYFNPENI